MVLQNNPDRNILCGKRCKPCLPYFCPESEPDQQWDPPKRGELPAKHNEHQLKYELGEINDQYLSSIKTVMLSFPGPAWCCWWQEGRTQTQRGIIRPHGVRAEEC